MIGQSSVKSALKVDVAISSYMATALQLWSQMYNNWSPWLGKDVKSLNLPAAIAGEIARAVTIEMKITVTGSPRADWLQEQVNQLLPKLREYTEYGCAKGGLMFKPYIAGDRIAIDCVQADMFYPVSFDGNGNITACVFADTRVIGHDFYTRLELHQMQPGGCLIKNMAFKSTVKDQLGQVVSLGTIADWAEILPEAVITGIDQPLFAYFRYPQANNIDPTSPLGVSCYARACNLIEAADRQWSDLLWEFESGQRALYVDDMAFGRDKDGKPLLPNKRLYRALSQGGQISDEEMFHEWSPTLREQSILAGMDAILRKIEFTCGLAYGTLSNPETISKTATEIKISNQRSYATVTDTQKSLQTALDRLLYAIDTWASLGNLAPTGTYQMTIDFDDSIITDKETQMSQDRQSVSMGVMPKYLFLMRNYGLDETTARAWITETQNQNDSQDFFGGPNAQ